MRFFQLLLLLCLSGISFGSYSAETNCPRIISQSPYISELLDYLGMHHCIVGVSRYSKLELPHTGGIIDPDAEAIDALMPDLIITSDWTKPGVLKKVTPSGAKAIRLSSFNNMAQLEQNMHRIIEASGWQHATGKVGQFSQAWRSKLGQIKGENKKVLLLSSCSGSPYSFGPNSRLYDLFTRAGFRVIETKEKIRHIKPGEEIKTLNALLERYQPDLLFIFEQRMKKQCQIIIPKVPVRIISLDGDNFLHPSVKILQGLDTLISKQSAWQ